MGNQKNGLVLEVGCGRGSISSYFADNGFDVFLLDYSEIVLINAKDIFNNNHHKGSFICGDALSLPLKDNQFDIVVSIGLLEHFIDIKRLIKEQIRILKPEGLFLGYIVPENRNNIQKYFNWINRILKNINYLNNKKIKQVNKSNIFRSDYFSKDYLEAIKNQNIKEIEIIGVYPLPLLSHSPEFPFSLMPRTLEFILTKMFNFVLLIRKIVYKHNPWICDESIGQAFLLKFRRI